MESRSRTGSKRDGVSRWKDEREREGTHNTSTGGLGTRRVIVIVIVTVIVIVIAVTFGNRTVTVLIQHS